MRLFMLILVLHHLTVAYDTYGTNWCCDLLLCSLYSFSPLQSTFEDIVMHIAPLLLQSLLNNVFINIRGVTALIQETIYNHFFLTSVVFLLTETILLEAGYPVA